MYKWPTVNFNEEDANPWITWFNKQVLKRNNCINAITTGLPGTGKSWSNLSLLCLRNPDFDVNEQCFFYASKMTKAFNKEDFFNRKGKEIMLDEAGIDLSSTNWRNAINKGIHAFFQTARHRNYIFMMTVPHIGFVSKSIRTLMTCQFTTNGWTSDNLTKTVPRIIEYNGEKDKFYKKRLIVKKDGLLQYCDEIRVPKPPKKIVEEYEKIKREFTTKLFGKIENKIKFYETMEQKETYNLSWREFNIYNFIRGGGKTGRSIEDIQEELKLEKRQVQASIHEMNKKGVKVFGIYNNRVFKGYVTPNE